MNELLSDNKRIVKNTSFLYARMLVMLFVSLWTSRIILRELGDEDFGLYNVVGSLVVLFSFIQGSLASSASRFLSFEIGKKSEERINKVFCAILNIHFLFCIFVFIFIETIGLWYLYKKMNIPDSRFDSAVIVYHMSAISAVLSILIVPYRALIISFEKMGTFAYLSIIEGLARFGIAICLIYYGGNKLVLYGFLVMFVQFIINIIYLVYCRKRFKESRYHLFWDKKLFKNILIYSGWSLCAYSSVVVIQGLNLLLNSFFGLIVNAANAVAAQVQTQVNTLCINFQTAINPQIVKSYAVGNYNRTRELIVMSEKISISLLFVVLFPLLCNIDYLLKIWLTDVPEYSRDLVIILCLYSLLGTFSNSLSATTEAANKLKRFNLILTPFYLFILPVAWVIVKIGFGPQYVMSLLILFEFIAFFLKLRIVNSFLELDNLLILKLFSKCITSVLFGFIVGYIINYFIFESITGLILKLFISFIFSLFWVCIFVLNSSDRNILYNSIKSIISKFN